MAGKVPVRHIRLDLFSLESPLSCSPRQPFARILVELLTE